MGLRDHCENVDVKKFLPILPNRVSIRRAGKTDRFLPGRHRRRRIEQAAFRTNQPQFLTLLGGALDQRRPHFAARQADHLLQGFYAGPVPLCVPGHLALQQFAVLPVTMTVGTFSST